VEYNIDTTTQEDLMDTAQIVQEILDIDFSGGVVHPAVADWILNKDLDDIDWHCYVVNID
jgi:hypothetical protein